MKGKNVGLGAALLISLTGAIPAKAATITLSNSYGTTNGGEFIAAHSGLPFSPVNLALLPAAPFETFCVEKNEYVSYGTPYWADVSTAAISGGIGGGSPDPLSPLTAYLYERFAIGLLAGYTYGVGDGGVARSASADALQRVIWYIEDEEAKSWIDGDLSLRDQFYQDALANAGPDLGNVRVLNLWADANRGHHIQDQLVLMPEPAAAIIMVAALPILLGIRRRTIELPRR